MMRPAGCRLGLSLLLLLLPLPAAPHAEEASEEGSRHAGPHRHGAHHWSYADKAEWASDFPSCGGLMQSPINIDTAAALLSPPPEPLLLSGYSLPPEVQLCLRNNGHTVVLSLPGSMTLSGGGFPQPYQAAQLHLHWGSVMGMPGSEHTVDGHRYAGEIHVVHYSSHFGSIQEAATEPGGLAVLAAFLQEGSEENEPFQHILEHLGKVHEEGEETFIAGFDVARLLPDDLERYFHYNGSLTTPPCYQTVNWTILNQTVQLSHAQLSRLEGSLWEDDHTPIQSNFRLPQSLNGRRVWASFSIPRVPSRARRPDGGDPPKTPPVPAGPTESADAPAPDEGEEGGFSPPPGAPAGRDPEPSGKEDAEKQLGSSLRTGDVLAVLFGALFGATAFAFLLYVYKHRSKNRSRLDAQAAKPSVIYTPASASEENPI